MRVLFASLPIHRKLIVMAVIVSGASLVIAIGSLAAFDVARFRVAVGEAVRGNAQLLAENVTAALVFDDPDAVGRTMGTLAVRPYFTHACVYRADGSLVGGYVRPGSAPCPAAPADRQTWMESGSVVPIQLNGQTIGYCYVERSLADLRQRVAVTAGAG